MVKLTPSMEHNTYQLIEEFNYKNCTVPVGISYKLRLVALIIDKYSPKYITAAVVHDYLTDEGNWELANKYFEELLPKGIISKLMVVSVKLYRKVTNKQPS